MHYSTRAPLDRDLKSRRMLAAASALMFPAAAAAALPLVTAANNDIETGHVTELGLDPDPHTASRVAVKTFSRRILSLMRIHRAAPPPPTPGHREVRVGGDAASSVINQRDEARFNDDIHMAAAQRLTAAHKASLRAASAGDPKTAKPMCQPVLGVWSMGGGKKVKSRSDIGAGVSEHQQHQHQQSQSQEEEQCPVRKD